MKPVTLPILVVCFGALCLGGCSLFTPPARDIAPIAMPDRFSLYTESGAGPGDWWQAFGSHELDALVNQALAGNFDIRTAVSKVRQAEAEARKAGADLSPALDVEGGAEKSWQRAKTDAGGTSSDVSKTLSTGLAAGYELDLWGKLSALHTSELLEYRATREDLEAAAVTVAADVTTAWVEVLSVRQQIATVTGQIDTNRKMLDLQELRFLNGQADTLDVSQQREALAEARALLPPLQLEEETQLNALAVLLGRAGNPKVEIKIKV